MTYSWTAKESPHPENPRTPASGRENPQSESASVDLVLVLVLLLLSSPHGKAGSAGNQAYAHKIFEPQVEFKNEEKT